MKLQLRSLTATLAVLFSLASSPMVRAVDLYNTLSNRVDILTQVSTSNGVGLSFKTTPTEYLIDTVTVKLANDELDPAGYGNVTIAIYNASGANSTPGSIVGTPIGSVPVSSLTTTLTDFSFTGLNRTLSPSTNYWITLTSTDMPPNSSGYAHTGVIRDSSGTLTTGSLGSTFKSSGSGWSTFNNFWVQGSVSTVAVPEPSTYALAAIASGVMAAVARRRKARLG
jgi:hypothetical protein